MLELKKNVPNKLNKSLLDLANERDVHRLVFDSFFDRGTSSCVMKIIEFAKKDENILRVEFGGIWLHPLFAKQSLLFSLYRKSLVHDQKSFQEYLNKNSFPYTHIKKELKSDNSFGNYLVYNLEARVACYFIEETL